MRNKLNFRKKDWKILYELERDASQTLHSIAKRVGTSKQLVRYVLEKFEKEKIILGYSSIIDTSRLGYYSYRVYLKFQNLNKISEFNNFISFLKKFPEITTINRISGSWDLGFIVSVKDIYDFYSLWERIMKTKKKIYKYDISIYSPVHHFLRIFLSPTPEKEKISERIIGGRKKEDFDEFDIKILKILSLNARKSMTEIASKLNRSAQFISKRIKLLEKKEIIQGYRVLLNWNLLGYEYYKVDLFLNSFKKNKEIFRYCKNHPNITQVNKTMSESDFELEAYFKSKREFLDLIEDIKEKFEDVLLRYKYFLVEEPYKEIFMFN